VLTPLIYFIHGRIEKYLGKNLAGEMKNAAMNSGSSAPAS
jgi:hypothetical protein